ncbi:hypothetical protein BV25DRAFT_682059 [Artomyces pyxidatus]|uniref:Uncharacterized protein n=1 Tax=Artomyces pyxidatus TaxID=48021 RepID=A0ACB8T1I7_9AGAM|nr:hypothetical protein BV25DRAFT_682059 [Artomyces pyxidatus]
MGSKESQTGEYGSVRYLPMAKMIPLLIGSTTILRSLEVQRRLTGVTSEQPRTLQVSPFGIRMPNASLSTYPHAVTQAACSTFCGCGRGFTVAGGHEVKFGIISDNSHRLRFMVLPWIGFGLFFTALPLAAASSSR